MGLIELLKVFDFFARDLVAVPFFVLDDHALLVGLLHFAFSRLAVLRLDTDFRLGSFGVLSVLSGLGVLRGLLFPILGLAV